eukprot:m.159372 g.159372  ORF g.159372 m.159372 type:complete len:59 (-) comp18002_c0_seq5:252-428(-)
MSDRQSFLSKVIVSIGRDPLISSFSKNLLPDIKSKRTKDMSDMEVQVTAKISIHACDK